jgi:hypothetical protein
MSYIDGFINQNAGTMTRDQIVTSLRAAGYDQREISAAMRRSRTRPAQKAPEQPATPSWAQPTSRPADPAQAYIRQYRGQYPQETLRQQLLLAGHDAATVDAALRSTDAEPQANTDRGQSWYQRRPIQWLVGGLIILLWTFGEALPAPIWSVIVVVVVLVAAFRWLRGRGHI